MVVIIVWHFVWHGDVPVAWDNNILNTISATHIEHMLCELNFTTYSTPKTEQFSPCRIVTAPIA
jgi:hypothetical protein